MGFCGLSANLGTQKRAFKGGSSATTRSERKSCAWFINKHGVSRHVLPVTAGSTLWHPTPRCSSISWIIAYLLPGSLPSSRLALSMTTITHAPLVSRTPSLTLLDSPVKLRPTTKRARSPVPADQGQAQEHVIKRHKLSATVGVPTALVSEKERRKAEKLEKEAVWRAKYLEHFPRWIFFFDPDGFDQDTATMRKKLIRSVQSLGAVGVDCFYQRRSAHSFLVGARLSD